MFVVLKKIHSSSVKLKKVKQTSIGTIVVIYISCNTFIGVSSQKMGQLRIHYFGQILTDIFSDTYSDHLIKLFGLLLNFFENTEEFWYTNFYFHGRFRADPHPGNIFILPNNVICYLDFGMMGRVDQQSRENFAGLVISVVHRDEAKTVDSLLKLTIPYDDPNRHTLERDVAEFIDRHFYRPLKELELGKLLHQLMNMVAKHRLRLPPDHFLMIKALSTVEGLGRLLDPDFDVIEQSAPFVRRIQLDRLHPRRIARDSLDSGTEFLHLLKEVPAEFREILRLISQGKVKIAFEHRGLEPMLSTHDRISNRLAFAIVLASLVVGSALIVLSGIPPKWHDIPVVGLIGFVVAGMMGFWLLVSILKRGKM